MTNKHKQFPGQGDTSVSPPVPLAEKIGNGNKDTCQNMPPPAAVRNLETIQDLAGIAYGEYDVKTDSVTWFIYNGLMPDPNENSGTQTFREHAQNFSSPDSALLQEALEHSTRFNERTETVITSDISPTKRLRLRYTFIPLTEQSKPVTKVRCLMQDISETTTICPDKQERSEMFGPVAESVRDVLFRISLPDGTYEYISQAVERITGYPPHMWYKNPSLLQQMIHPAWRAKFDREFKRFIRVAETEEHLFPILHREGGIRWLQLRTTTLRDGQGEVVAVEGIASDVTERKREEMEKERLIRDLQKALTEVKTLSGLLPICSYCKKVRDDQGYWQQIESYITEHSELFFTHGLCPDCLTHHYPEYSITRSAGNQGRNT
jgi:PAS domain S-box-containing protein